jgi:hypothetical protein
MGREIKRVAAHFEWPIGKKWPGFNNPYSDYSQPCQSCDGSGYSPRGKELYDQWYGYSPFNPHDTGSNPFTPETPEVWSSAERNCTARPEWVIRNEAQRLCDLWNACWSHHLAQEDVDALLAGNRLWDFTRDFVPGEGWKDKPEPSTVTASDVNLWSIANFMGHDSINCWVCMQAKCEREGVSSTCATCGGDGTWWPAGDYKQRAEEWKAEEPPAGEWWQVWETVSEGSPVTPAFSTPEELIEYLVANGDSWDQKRLDGGWERSSAEQFVKSGWAPSLITAGGHVYEPRDGHP